MYAWGHLTLSEASSLLTEIARIRRIILAIHAMELLVLRTHATDDPHQQLDSRRFSLKSIKLVRIQEAQLMLTTGVTHLAVSRGQQTCYHFGFIATLLST